MSKEIDERVVSMQFDNALFEKNIQKSLKSIDDLNKSLNNLDGAKGLEEVSKAAKEVDLTPIIASAKSAEKSFSALEIAGITTISRLTNSLINFGAKMGKNFWDSTIGQIKSGGWKRASDIKAGEFMLEGLGFTGQRLKEISEAAKNAVSGTAAGLGEAMKSAGVLAASGLTDAQKMEDTLKGIAGVSAMTGRSFENIANIYSTVASNGKLMTMQMRQFSFAGINVAAELAKQMGTTEAAINDMVTKGQIDFDTFSKAMTDAFGEHAKDANKTFTGALANMKAALSRIGERFATPLMDNLRTVFNSLRQTFNAVNKAMEPIYQDFEKLFYIGQRFITNILGNLYSEDDKGNLDSYSSALDNIIKSIRNLYSIVIMVFGTIAQAFKEVFPPLRDTTATVEKFTASLVPTQDGLKVLKVAFKAIFSVIKAFTDALGTAIEMGLTVASVIFAIANRIIGAFAGLDEMTGGLFNMIKNINIFEIALDGICAAILAIGGAVSGVIILIKNLIDKLKDLVNFDSIKRLGIYIIEGLYNGLKIGFNTLKKAWLAIVSFIPDTITKTLKIASPSRVMKTIGKFIVMGLVVGILSNKIELDEAVNTLSGSFSSLITFAQDLGVLIGKYVSSAVDKLLGFINKVKNKFEELQLKRINNQLTETKNNIDKVNDSIQNGSVKGIEKTGEAFSEVNKDMAKSSEYLEDNVTGVYDTISEKLKELGVDIEGFKIIIAGFGTALVATFTQTALNMNMFSSIGRLVATLSVAVGAFILLKNVDFTPFIDGIKALYYTIKDYFLNLDIATKIETFMDKIRSMIEKNELIVLASKTLVFSFAIVMIRMLHNISTLITAVTNTVRRLTKLTGINISVIETTSDKILKMALSLSIVVTSLAYLGHSWKSNEEGMKYAKDMVIGIIVLMTAFTTVLAIISSNRKSSIIATNIMKEVQAAALAIMLMATSLIAIGYMLSNYSTDSIVYAFVTFISAMIAFGALIKAMNNVDISGISVPMCIGLSLIFLSVGYMMETMIKSFSGVIGWQGTLKRLSAAIVPMIAAIAGIALLLNTLKDFEYNLDKSESKTEKSNKRRKKSKTLMSSIENIFGANEHESKKISDNAAKTILALSVLVTSLVGLIKIMSTFNNLDIFSSLTLFGIIILSLAGILKLLEHYSSAIDKLGDFMQQFAISLLAATAACALIGKMPIEVWGDGLSRITAIGTILMLMLIGFGIILKNVIGEGSKIAMSIKGLGLTLAAIGVGLSVLSGVFALMPKDRLTKFAVWTGTLVLIISGLIILIELIRGFSGMLKGGEGSTDKTKNTLLSLIGLFGTIAMMMMSLIVLSFVDPVALLAPIGAIVTLMLGIIGILTVMSELNNNLGNAGTVFIALGAMIAAISLCVTIMSALPTDAVKTIASGAAIFIALLPLIWIIREMTNVKIGRAAVGSLIALVAIIAATGLILLGLTALQQDSIGALTAGLSLLLVFAGVALLVNYINSMEINSKTFANLLAIGGMVLLIGTALAMLAYFGGNNIMAAVAGIAAAAAAMTVFALVIGAISKWAPGANLLLDSLALAFIGFAAAATTFSLAVGLISIGFAVTAAVLTLFFTALQNIDMKAIGEGLGYVALGVLKLAGALAIGVAAIGIAMIAFGNHLLPLFIGLGGYLMSGLIKGIVKKEGAVAEAGADAIYSAEAGAEKAGMIASPSKLFRRIGEFLMSGLVQGIVSGIPVVGETLSNALTNIFNWLTDKADEFEKVGDTWSKAGEVLFKDFASAKLGIGENGLGGFLDQFTEGIDDLVPSVDDLSEGFEDMGTSADTASSGVDNLNNSMSNAIDMFSEFNDQAYMTSKDVLPAFMSQIEGVTKWRDELASLSARGLGEVIVQELEQMGPQAYEKVHALYTMTNSELAMMNIMYKQKLALQNGSIKKIDKSFKKLGDTVNETMEESMDEMNDNMVNSMDSMAGNMMKALKKQMDYEKVINQVTGFRDNIADKIRNSMSIFEAVNEQEEIKAEELLKNMKDQVKHVGKWASMITEMAAKGFNEGLVATLTDMGPQSYSKVAAFLTMSEEQIAEANRLYEASEQVPEYGADKIVKAFAQAGFTASMGLTDSFLEGLDPEAVEQAMSDLGQRSITSLQEEIANKPYELGEMIPSDFADGLVTAAEAETERVKTAMQDLADAANIENYLEDKSLPQEPLKTVRSPEREAQAAAEMEAIRKSQHNYDKIYREQQAKADKIRLSRENKDEDYISEHPIQDEQITENYIEKYDAYLQSAIDKVNEYYKQNKIKIDLNQFMQMEFTDDGNVWKYNIKELNKNGLLTHLMDLSGSDAEAKAMLDYVKNISTYATDEEGFYTAGSTNTKGFAKGTADSSALKDVEESGVKVKDTTINGLAGGGGGHYAVNAIDKTPLAMAAKNVALGATLAFADSIESDESMDATNTAAQNLAGSFIISLRDNLASLMDAILNSDEATPKIKPVIDTTDVRSKVSDIFKGLNFSTGIDVSTKTRDKSVVDAINGISNKEVVDAVNDLASMVDNLRMQATRLQVVMDTGQLVGVLTPGIDQSLGMNAINAGRWVI